MSSAVQVSQQYVLASRNSKKMHQNLHYKQTVSTDLLKNTKSILNFDKSRVDKTKVTL